MKPAAADLQRDVLNSIGAFGKIVVTTTSSEIALDGQCSLPEAILHANTRGPAVADLSGDHPELQAGECSGAVAGGNRIVLPAGSISLRSAYDVAGHNGLPPVTSVLVIQGSGKREEAKSVIERDLGAEPFRIIDVEPSGDLTLLQLQVNNGDVSRFSNESGGGIENLGKLFVQDCFFGGNKAEMAGGAIFNPGSATIKDSTFKENETGDSVGSGGALFSTGALAVSGSYFHSNSAFFGGAVGSFGETTISGSAFDWNKAAIAGGAIEAWGKLKMDDSTLVFNTATNYGGAMHIAFPVGAVLSLLFGDGSVGSGDVALESVTIADNWVKPIGVKEGDGGGVWVSSDGSVSLHNTLVGQNLNIQDRVASDCSGRVLSEGYNLVGSDRGCTVVSSGKDQIGTEEKPIEVGLAPATFSNSLVVMPLLTGSPAIDRGDPASCPGTDQRGVKRPQEAACDIGAYEATKSIDVKLSPILMDDFGSFR